MRREMQLGGNSDKALPPPSLTTPSSTPPPGSQVGSSLEFGGVLYPTMCKPHLLLHGSSGNGQTALAAALMHSMEHSSGIQSVTTQSSTSVGP